MTKPSMEVKCVVIELKPNSITRVQEWAAHLKANKTETMQSLKNKGITDENYFLFTLNSKNYLIGYMRAESLALASKAVKESLLKIDAYHQQFKKDVWENILKTELVVDLSRIPDD